jgi:microcystin-dependent protein
MTNVATLQTAADLSASITAQGVSSLVPAGVILAFGGATAPTGWLLCEGALVSRTTYADLYAAILNAHGSGDGTTTFALPDYRGRFIRGRDNAAARDADRALRSAAQAGGNTADAVGSVQGIATSISSGTTNKSTTGLGGTAAGQSHTGNSPSVNAVQETIYNSGAGSTHPTGQSTTVNPYTSPVSHTHTVSITHTHAASALTVTGDNETRPLNAYVNYIIKI